jgi:hypothetical protein
MKAIAVVLCILVLGLTAGCAPVGSDAYRSDQEKQLHYGYQPQTLRLLTI